MSRALAYGIGLSVVAAVIAPVFADASYDSYPFSTYPMFARRRIKPLLYFVEGAPRRGAPVRLPPEFVANEEVMQAAASVRRAVEGGPDAMERLCERVARRVTESGREEHRGVRRVRIVGARFDPLTYFTVEPVPEERTELFTCKVPGRS